MNSSPCAVRTIFGKRIGIKSRVKITKLMVDYAAQSSDLPKRYTDAVHPDTLDGMHVGIKLGEKSVIRCDGVAKISLLHGLFIHVNNLPEVDTIWLQMAGTTFNLKWEQ